MILSRRASEQTERCYLEIIPCYRLADLGCYLFPLQKRDQIDSEPLLTDNRHKIHYLVYTKYIAQRAATIYNQRQYIHFTTIITVQF